MASGRDGFGSGCAAPLALLWRTRRYLADGSAVQLTRNPGALARGLIKIGAADALPAGGEYREYLFVHAPERIVAGGFADQRGLVAGLQPRSSAEACRLAERRSFFNGPATTERLLCGTWEPVA